MARAPHACRRLLWHANLPTDVLRALGRHKHDCFKNLCRCCQIPKRVQRLYLTPEVSRCRVVAAARVVVVAPRISVASIYCCGETSSHALPQNYQVPLTWIRPTTATLVAPPSPVSPSSSFFSQFSRRRNYGAAIGRCVHYGRLSCARPTQPNARELTWQTASHERFVSPRCSSPRPFPT